MRAPAVQDDFHLLDEDQLMQYLDNEAESAYSEHDTVINQIAGTQLNAQCQSMELPQVRLLSDQFPSAAMRPMPSPAFEPHHPESKEYASEVFLRALGGFTLLGSDSEEELSYVSLSESDSDLEINEDLFPGAGSIPPRLPPDREHLPRMLLPVIDSLTTAVQSLWSHRLFRHYLERWFPNDSEFVILGQLCTPLQLPTVAVPLICHLFRGRLVRLLNWMVDGRYNDFMAILNDSGISNEHKEALFAIASEYWEGGDEIELSHRFHVALEGISPERMRCLNRARANLFQRNRDASIWRAEENLELVQDALNIIVKLIRRDLDERVRFEIDEIAQCAEPQPKKRKLKFSGQQVQYKPGTLGYKLERLIHRIANRLRQHFDEEYFGKVLDDCVDACLHDEETDCYIKVLDEDRETFTKVLSDLSTLFMLPAEGFLTTTLENLLKSILAHDSSDFVEELVYALHQSVMVYFETKDKIENYTPTNPAPLLRDLEKQQDLRWGLHRNVPSATDTETVRRADTDFFVHTVIPKIKDLVFPNSSLLSELIQAFITSDRSWDSAVGVEEQHAAIAKAIFSGVDHTLALLASGPIVDKLNEQLEPKRINLLIIDYVEQKWQEEIEDCDDPIRLEELQRHQADYKRKKRAICGTKDHITYVTSSVAIRYAILLWAPEPLPGVHALITSTSLQIHELLQCKPVVKSILFHVIESLLQHLQFKPRRAAADLNKPIHKVMRKHGGEGPFKEECMREMASGLLDLLRIGSSHLPREISYAGWGTIIIAKVLDYFSESWLIEKIRKELEVIWVEKFELSFPGILAYFLDQVHIWIKDPDDGLDTFLKEKTGKLPLGL